MKVQVKSLVLYHNAPAIVQAIDDKIAIKLENGKEKKVRLKDISLLFEGSVSDFSFINNNVSGDIEGAWNLLQDEEGVSIYELTELIFGEQTAETVWNAWQILKKGEYFKGTLEEIIALSEEEVQSIVEQQQKKENAKSKFEEYIQRVKAGAVIDDDLPLLKSIEQVALSKITSDRTLKALGIEATPQKAHNLLLKLNLWHKYFNPFPLMLDISMQSPNINIPDITMENRKDLTYLDSYAIDDDNCSDPDDALSFDNGAVWVHVADVADIVSPDSPQDLEARNRGSNLYLPEKIVTMLPNNATEKCGLGLSEVSPALSFKIILDSDENPKCEEITLSTVKVKRTTYNAAEEMIDSEPLKSIYKLTEKFHKRRIDAGAAEINLPEVKLKVSNISTSFDKQNSTYICLSNTDLSRPEITIFSLKNTRSRQLVTDAMLMAGEAVANWLYENKIPAPYASQLPPEEKLSPQSIVEMFQYRKQFKRTEISLSPSLHAGLGLTQYTRVTSPLRRYSDLLVHQQIRAFLLNKALLNSDEILERISFAEEQAFLRSKAERQSNTHWKLIKMQQDMDSVYTGIVVEIFNGRVTIFIPSLAINTKLRGAGSMSEGSEVKVKVSYVNIPEQEFRIQLV